ncbi:MAG: hypothetical protein CBD18_02190 [Opitutales bacterium TMED158]|nr:MAG: hypothetical protein CBD18_02190 [Opitutales bacterium TMED158]
MLRGRFGGGVSDRRFAWGWSACRFEIEARTDLRADPSNLISFIFFDHVSLLLCFGEVSM